MEDEMYDVKQVANWFLRKEQMSHKKLQMLCFYAYSWYLYMCNDIEEGLFTRLFANDIEGWVHGPSSRKLSDAFPHSGADPLQPVEEYGTIPADDAGTCEFFEKIYAAFGGFTASELEIMACREKPWIASRKGLKSWEPGTTIISDDLMYSFCAEMNEEED